MYAGRITENCIKGLVLLTLFIALALKSFVAEAQSLKEMTDQEIYDKVRAMDDSTDKFKRKINPLYVGYELSIGVPQFRLTTKTPAFNGFKASYLGFNAGGVVANTQGKLKATIGYYYSDPSVPYSLDMIQGGVSANIYLLRIKETVYHAFEPYAVVGASYLQNRFYGTHPLNQPVANYSTVGEQRLGSCGWTQMTAGLGVEYQLESTRNFIHLFTEAGYGMAMNTNASSADFAQTNLPHSFWFSIGVSFGIVK